MTAAVLDASALVALLRGEPGHERVSAVLADSVISVVNLAEVAGFFARNGMPSADVRRLLAPLPSVPVPLDVELAYDVGFLLPATKAAGLSLGDRACMALAMRLGVKALTADKSWAAIATAIGATVEVIR